MNEARRTAIGEEGDGGGESVVMVLSLAELAGESDGVV